MSPVFFSCRGPFPPFFLFHSKMNYIHGSESFLCGFLSRFAMGFLRQNHDICFERERKQLSRDREYQFLPNYQGCEEISDGNVGGNFQNFFSHFWWKFPTLITCRHLRFWLFILFVIFVLRGRKQSSRDQEYYFFAEIHAMERNFQ